MGFGFGLVLGLGLGLGLVLVAPIFVSESEMAVARSRATLPSPRSWSALGLGSGSGSGSGWGEGEGQSCPAHAAVVPLRGATVRGTYGTQEAGTRVPYRPRGPGASCPEPSVRRRQARVQYGGPGDVRVSTAHAPAGLGLRLC